MVTLSAPRSVGRTVGIGVSLLVVSRIPMRKIHTFKVSPNMMAPLLAPRLPDPPSRGRELDDLDGDLLAVQATHEARNGQIVVARLGDEVTVKRYQRLPSHIELHPENPDYPTIVVQPGEPFAIEGLAVGLIRNSVLM